MALERQGDKTNHSRFVVEGNVCFVKLLTQGPVGVGLVLHGESQLEEFCKEAIAAYKQLVNNRRSTNKSVEDDLRKVDEE